MHPMRSAGARQRHALKRGLRPIDAYAFFDLLTDASMLSQVEAHLPAHRERLLPPTETLAMSLAQALSADRSCQYTVNAFVARRLAGGRSACSSTAVRTASIAERPGRQPSECSWNTFSNTGFRVPPNNVMGRLACARRSAQRTLAASGFCDGVRRPTTCTASACASMLYPRPSPRRKDGSKGQRQDCQTAVRHQSRGFELSARRASAVTNGIYGSKRYVITFQFYLGDKGGFDGSSDAWRTGIGFGDRSRGPGGLCGRARPAGAG